MKNNTRVDTLINALKEIESICKSQPKCSTSCPFAHPIDHYCEIMGFVDDFAEWHLHDEIEVNPNYIVNGLDEVGE